MSIILTNDNRAHVIIKSDAIYLRQTQRILSILNASCGVTPQTARLMLITENVLFEWNPSIASLPDHDRVEVVSYYTRPMLYVELKIPSDNDECYRCLLESKLKIRNILGADNYRNFLHVPNNANEAMLEYSIYRNNLFTIAMDYDTLLAKGENMCRILIVGDSLVEGVGDPEKRGWATRLSTVPGMLVTSDGVGGRTALDVLETVDKLPEGFDLALVQVGLNDSRYRDTLMGSEVSLSRYCKSITEIVRILQSKAIRVAILGLTRVDEKLTDPYKIDKSYRNQLIEIYDQRLKEMSQDEPFDYIPVPTLTNTPDLLFDGLHPSSEGHQLLLESVLAYIDARCAQQR